MREVEDCLECERAGALKDGDVTGFAPNRGGEANFGETGKD